jgi:hypothetical protein
VYRHETVGFIPNSGEAAQHEFSSANSSSDYSLIDFHVNKKFLPPLPGASRTIHFSLDISRRVFHGNF